MLPQPENSSVALGVVLLGAGASSRMGKPKLLLPWGSTSVVGRHLALWRRLGARQIGVVCAPEPHPLHVELDRLGIAEANRVINPVPERGMFSSIQYAARWTGWNPGLSHWAIVLGDQPHVPLDVLDALLEFATGNSDSVVQPARKGRARHPVILPATHFRRLATSDATHLKEFLARLDRPVRYCEVDHPALDLDLDTPEDYQRALREFGPHVDRSAP